MPEMSWGAPEQTRTKGNGRRMAGMAGEWQGTLNKTTARAVSNGKWDLSWGVPVLRDLSWGVPVLRPRIPTSKPKLPHL